MNNLQKEDFFLNDEELGFHEKKANEITQTTRPDIFKKEEKEPRPIQKKNKKDEILNLKREVVVEEEQPKPKFTLEKKAEQKIFVATEKAQEVKKPKAVKKANTEEVEIDSDEMTTFEELAKKIPSAHREKFWKILHKHGIREDDYLAGLLEVTGFVNTVYKTVPESNKKLSENIKRATELYIEQISNEREKTKIQMEELANSYVNKIKEEQEKVSKEFSVAAENYLRIISEGNKNAEAVVRSQREKVNVLVSESLHQTLPKIVNKHLSELIDDAKDTGLKRFLWNSFHNILLVTLGVLMSQTIVGIFSKL